MSPCTDIADTVCETKCGHEDFGDGKLSWNGVEFATGDDGECGDITKCTNKVAFELTAPTPTSDRVCQNYTWCDFGNQYEVVPFTKTSDRVCKDATVCNNLGENATEYEATKPTVVSDRMCQNYSACEDDEWEYVPITPFSNRKCRVKKTCVEGLEIETSPGNATTDRDCGPIPEVVGEGEGEEEPLASIAAEDASASTVSGSGGFLLFVLACAIVAALIYFTAQNQGASLVSEKNANKFEQLYAGEVAADAVDVAFEGGDFWFIDESSVEVLPHVHFLRKAPLAFANTRYNGNLDDDELNDTASDIGEYLLVQDSNPVPQLLSQTTINADYIATPQPQGYLPPSLLQQTPLPQIQYAVPAQAPYEPPAPVMAVEPQLDMSAIMAIEPQMDMSALGLGGPITLDLGIVGAPAPVGGPAPEGEDDEDTKL